MGHWLLFELVLVNGCTSKLTQGRTNHISAAGIVAVHSAISPFHHGTRLEWSKMGVKGHSSDSISGSKDWDLLR